MFYNKLEGELKTLKKDFNFRELRDKKKNYTLDFSSNDYLDLLSDKDFISEFWRGYLNNNKPLLGSTGSRLLGGNYTEIIQFEEDVNKVFKKKSIVFGSGYDANTTVIETFYKKSDVIFTDRYNHASIYDGLINSNVKIVRYKHLDYKDLENKLAKYRGEYNNSLIITESIYSMDGDIVDLKKIVALKDQYNSQLFLDEAHSYGALGYGLAFNENLVSEIDFIMLGLGKGGASNGGILILNKIAHSYIVNRGRRFIYTTSPSPLQTSWNHYVFNKIPNLKEKIHKLEKLKATVYKLLNKENIKTISTEQIISIIIGDNKKNIEIAKNLEALGYNLYPIKEPTVPKGTSRLRLTLTADMPIKKIEKFIHLLALSINGN